ncbi:MAG: hypothetical protein PUG28_03180, partial [Gemmiger formicilis]|nr:hypothetical protein [Gemmiger formicilis]
SIAEGVGLPDINSLGKDDGETENVQVFDFDLYIDQFKEENNIEINPDDNGTDISDIDSLHDWLYSNGVDRTSVQNDRDSGCKNPYLDGYLEYLDSLVEKAAGTVASSSAPEKVDPSTISGEKITLDGIDGEFTSDGAGGVYSPDGYHYTKEEWDNIKSSQKELAELRENLDLPEEKHLTEEDKEKADQAVIDAFKDIYG